MDSKILSAVAGIVLSLAFFYIPGLNEWYNKQTSQAKSLIMLGVMLVVAAASFGLACWGIFDIPITCDKAGAVGLFQAFVYALVANQATYTVFRRLTPQ
jgi:hypothetical protein